jgi:dihydroorotate dehydrogenase electron transfer subunit
MIETVAIVIDNHELAPGYRVLTLSFAEAFEVRPGQFAMLRAHSLPEPLLRRALAIYDAPQPGRLSFLYQVLGRGTQCLSQLGPGSQVDALLPLGNAWPMPGSPEEHNVSGSVEPRPAAAWDSSQPTPLAVVVAGGIGSASVLTLARLLQQGRVETEIFLGAANAQVATGCGLADFQSLGIPLTVSTDDGSLGERGFVTVPLGRFLSQHQGRDITVYSCGPWAMMARTAGIAASASARCLVSLEAPMACGFGVCVGCVFAVRTAEPNSYGSYKRVCTDGTVFNADEVAWEISAMSH